MNDILSQAQALMSDSDFAEDFAAARELGRDIAIATVAMHTRQRGMYADNRRIADHLLSAPQGSDFAGSPAQPQAAQTVAMTPKEPPVFFSTQTLLNGADISKMSNDQIYAAIAAKKAQIDALAKIEPKPARLVKEIDAATADLNALVKYLDDQDAVKTPATKA